MDAKDKQVPKCEISWSQKHQLLYLQKAHLNFKLVTYLYRKLFSVVI